MAVHFVKLNAKVLSLLFLAEYALGLLFWTFLLILFYDEK